MRSRKPRRRTRARRKKRWLLATAVVALSIVVASLLLVLPLRWMNPPATSFMLQDRSGRDPVRYEWASLSEIGVAPALAVVAAEDQRFLEHHGVDFTSMEKALREHADGGRLRGASTISQQLAKNLYLWSGRSFIRKGLEAWFAMLLEVCLPKRRILELYLNVVELGPGIYGVPAASRQYFGSDPARISDRRAALLAAVLPNPHRLSVSRPSAYVRDRQRWILGQMQRLRREYWITALD